MFLQDPLLAERLVTDLADVGLVSGMGALVAPLVAGAVEALVAVLALEGLLTGVDELVFVKEMSRLERLVAHGTWKRFGSCTYYHTKEGYKIMDNEQCPSVLLPISVIRSSWNKNYSLLVYELPHVSTYS